MRRIHWAPAWEYCIQRLPAVRGSLRDAEKASLPHLHIFALTKQCRLLPSTSYDVLRYNRVRDTSRVAPACAALSKARLLLSPPRLRSQSHRRRCCAPAREQRDPGWSPRETAGVQVYRYTQRCYQASRCYWERATANSQFSQGRHLPRPRAYIGRICQTNSTPCYPGSYHMLFLDGIIVLTNSRSIPLIQTS